MFRRLCEHFVYFLEFAFDTGAGDVATMALWTFLTYAYPAWSAVPYLHIGGPFASAKTRAVRLLAQVVFRPLQSSNMTAACLFRTMHASGGTCS